MKHKKFFFLLLLLVSVLRGYAQTTLFVSAGGNDRNDGTRDRPFASIDRAKMEARKKKGKIIVYLRGGTYYLSASVVFSPDDARKPGEGITYKAYKNEKVIISGAKSLMVKWEIYRDEILQAKIDETLQYDRLFVNGELQHMARYPNYNAKARIFNGTAADAIDPVRTKRWSDPAGAYVHALHRAEWGDFHYIITKKDEQGLPVLEGGWQNNRRMGMHREYRFVENVMEELDTANEWYADRKRSLLFYYPPATMNTKNLKIELPQLKHLFEFRGTEEKPVTNITIEGLVLTQTERTFMDTKEPLLRSDWTIYRGGAVVFTGTENCTIKNCELFDLGGNGVFFSNYNRRSEVSGCHFKNIGASAVCFVGDPSAVRSALFEYNESLPLEKINRQKGPATNNFPAQCLVYNNLIHDIGREEKQVAGVQVSMSQDIRVSHNTIYNVPRAGININDGTWGGHIIEYNDVFNTVLETGDHGAFNSWGRDRYWHPARRVMDSITTVYRDELVLLDAVHTNVLRYNRFRCDHGWDIDLDDGSTNYHIYNNVLLNGGLKLREGFFRKAENNSILNNSFHPHVWFKNSDDVFVKNVVAGSYKPIRVTSWGKEVNRNVFLDSLSLLKEQQQGHDKMSLYAPADFINAATGDYRLKPGSPAFKTGFQNFSMNEFGVISAKLRSLADKVRLPELFSPGKEKPETLETFMGLKIKNLNTLAERSATGMDAERGVLVKEVMAASPFSGYLRPNDVILAYNDVPVNNTRALQKAGMGKQVAGNMLSLKIFRDQKEQMIAVKLK